MKQASKKYMDLYTSRNICGAVAWRTPPATAPGASGRRKAGARLRVHKGDHRAIGFYRLRAKQCLRALDRGESGAETVPQPRCKLVQRDGAHRIELLLIEGGSAHPAAADGRNLQA